MKIGAAYLGQGRCDFTVWAPLRSEVAVQIVAPQERLIHMQQNARGYWQTKATDIEPGTLYKYLLDGELDRPDPASHSQPEDVHGPSQVVDHDAFHWDERGWNNIPLEDWIIYELHVGTFTPEGTFEAIIARLPQLKQVGINAIEIMPVAQFPGDRNWGYDGVYPFAVQHSYGGPEGLKRLVNACHQQGIAVVLDVVYNHFGPEGNYTMEFGPYFTEKYRTPWGSAINYDDPHSDGVRNYVIENVLLWFRDYHIDGLRLDAIHAIYDLGAKHILTDIAESTADLSQQLGRKFFLIAESDLNDVRVIRPPSLGGYGIDAQWSDDFHHSLRTILTDERTGYYSDFGECQQFEIVMRESFIYSWRYSPFRKRYHGSYAGDRPTSQFVVCNQNHDQIGNRMLGERLSQLASFDALKLAAGAVLLSPYIPMLFMGEEYGEEAPFLYFISHTDPDLVEAVRQGRKEEFADFHTAGEPPDPFATETFMQSKLNWEQRQQGKHKILLEFYQQLIQLRRQLPALKHLDRNGLEVASNETDKVLWFRRCHQDHQILCLLNFNLQVSSWDAPLPEGNWQKRLDSADPKWLGIEASLPDQIQPGKEIKLQPQSIALYELSI